jgi:hypothetical protein
LSGTHFAPLRGRGVPAVSVGAGPSRSQRFDEPLAARRGQPVGAVLATSSWRQGHRSRTAGRASRPALREAGSCTGISTIARVRAIVPRCPACASAERLFLAGGTGSVLTAGLDCRCHPASSPLASRDTLVRFVDCGSRLDGLGCVAGSRQDMLTSARPGQLTAARSRWNRPVGVQVSALRKHRL